MPRAGEDVSEWTLDEEYTIPTPGVLFRKEGFKWTHLGKIYICLKKMEHLKVTEGKAAGQ